MRALLAEYLQNETLIRLTLRGENEYNLNGIVQEFKGSLVAISYNEQTAWVDLGDILIVNEL